MMCRIFNKIKVISESGGIKLTLNFGDNKKYNVIAIPVMQLIIGELG